jgi:Ca-activated chloride channel family protein
VFTVGFGTPEGATIPDRDDDGSVTEHRDFAGRVVVTRLNESNLRDIARLTRGTYARWTSDASVTPIVSELTRMRAKPRTSSAGVALSDRFQWPLALALLALAAEPMIVTRRRK